MFFLLFLFSKISECVSATHNSCQRLLRCDLSKQETSLEVVVDVIYSPSEESSENFPAHFPGLFVSQLSPRPWGGRDSDRILFCTSIWGSRTRILMVFVTSRYCFLSFFFLFFLIFLLFLFLSMATQKTCQSRGGN